MPVLQDRFVKIMLVVIAALLVANLFRPADRSIPIFLENAAQAQDGRPSGPPTTPTGVSPIGGFRVSDVKDVISVGDGRTFVVANPHGFQVYRIDDQYTANLNR